MQTDLNYLHCKNLNKVTIFTYYTNILTLKIQIANPRFSILKYQQENTKLKSDNLLDVKRLCEYSPKMQILSSKTWKKEMWYKHKEHKISENSYTELKQISTHSLSEKETFGFSRWSRLAERWA